MRKCPIDVVDYRILNLIAVFFSLLLMVIFSYSFINYVVNEDAINETELNDTIFFGILSDVNVTKHTPVFKNVTILDKDYKQRSLLTDVYNVVYMSDGKISRVNDMELFYTVEKGKQYNVTWNYGIETVIKEV